jgi:hypothetical protein
MVDHQLVKWSKYCYKILNRYGRASFIDVYVALSHLKYVRCLQPRYLNDNSTRILSTNQIYEIDQYGPITFVLKKLPRKFSLVKIATKNFQQNVSTIFYFIEFFNLCSVNCHAEYKLVGTKLPETFSSDHSYLFLKTIFTCSLRSLVKIVAETNTRIWDRKFPAISYPLVVLLLRIALKCHMIYINKSQLRIVWIATNRNLIKRKFSLGKISDIIDLGKKFFGRFSSEYTSGQIYIARNFFLQSNTRVCRSKLPSGWRPRVIFLLQTLVCQDCSKKFPAIYLFLGILYMRIARKNFSLGKLYRKFSLGKISA